MQDFMFGIQNVNMELNLCSSKYLANIRGKFSKHGA